MFEQSQCFLIGIGRGHKCYLKSHDLGNLVEVNLRKDNLFGNS